MVIAWILATQVHASKWPGTAHTIRWLPLRAVCKRVFNIIGDVFVDPLCLLKGIDSRVPCIQDGHDGEPACPGWIWRGKDGQSDDEAGTGKRIGLITVRTTKG